MIHPSSSNLLDFRKKQIQFWVLVCKETIITVHLQTSFFSSYCLLLLLWHLYYVDITTFWGGQTPTDNSSTETVDKVDMAEYTNNKGAMIRRQLFTLDMQDTH